MLQVYDMNNSTIMGNGIMHIQEKLKERDEERERNITKRMNNMKRNMILFTKPY